MPNEAQAVLPSNPHTHMKTTLNHMNRDELNELIHDLKVSVYGFHPAEARELIASAHKRLRELPDESPASQAALAAHLRCYDV